MLGQLGRATVAAVGAMLAPVPVLAEATVNARVEISAAVAGSSATLESIERQANARDRVRQQEVAALQAQLVEARGQGASEIARLETELIAAREALVADLASRDRAYAEEIAVFRREVTQIASTPEGAAALARYNAGDRAGALGVLVRLRQARDAARQTRIDIESAADARQIATLALDARGKSDPAFDTGAVIVFYEEVVELDPGEYGDWYQLFQLYRAAGRSADALAAAERMEALAPDDRGRSRALVLAADVLLSQGDRAGAMSRYQLSLEAFERLTAEASPSPDLAQDIGLAIASIEEAMLGESETQQSRGRFTYTRSGEVYDLPSLDGPGAADSVRDLSVALIRIGDVLLSQGDRNGALTRYRRALLIRESLVEADSGSPARARDLAVSHAKIGDVLVALGRPGEALTAFEDSLAIAERLSAADPSSADRARDVSVWLLRIGDVLVSRGDPDGALARYRRSLQIAERLSSADPASAEFARDVSVSLNKSGDVLSSQGDFQGALPLYRRSLEINERLSSANPASTDRARDLSASLTRVGDMLLLRGDRDGALVQYRRSLEIAERLAMVDPASADRARDVSVSLAKMGEATREPRYWQRAQDILLDLEQRGLLRPEDQTYIEFLSEGLAIASREPD